MKMYSKFLVVVLLVCLGNGQTNSQDCSVLKGSLFGVICNLDLTNPTANQLCRNDCYCVHGAASGGKCVPSSSLLTADCKCDYTPNTIPITDNCATNPTNAALALECGPLSALVGEAVCALECNCFHGATGGSCTNQGVATTGGKKKCKCTYP